MERDRRTFPDLAADAGANPGDVIREAQEAQRHHVAIGQVRIARHIAQPHAATGAAVSRHHDQSPAVYIPADCTVVPTCYYVLARETGPLIRQV